MPPTVRDVVDALERAYPPELAEPWDAVGLVCGDPEDAVERALVCVDPVEATVDEAIELGAQLIVAHHPLLLRGVRAQAEPPRVVGDRETPRFSAPKERPVSSKVL
jgi:putative NIF3 family GTP cyclohydrolase 1 type 2